MESKLSRIGKEEEEKEDVELPGFRFYPTDEELTGFYLRRKAEKKHSSDIEFIKQIDIYMYDPWDLPMKKLGGNMGSDEECYFFCLRGRKYKNSIRPNRVTSSGYWKATGIDKEIYGHEDRKKSFCIGLKKSLVYYKGSSGKGTKTDWMMHEYRLPRDQENPNPNNPNEIQDVDQVWTLCRIFKRTSNYCRKQVAKADDQWRKLPSIRNDPIGISELKNWNSSDIGIWDKLDCHETHDTSSNDISLLNMSNMIHSNIEDHDLILSDDQFNIETPKFRCFGGLYRNEDWDELGAVVNAACSQFPLDFS